MTARQAARQHLPELDATYDRLRATFGAKLEYLSTPAGTWDSRPDWIKAAVPNGSPLPTVKPGEVLPAVYVTPAYADPTPHSPSLWTDGKPPRRTRK